MTRIVDGAAARWPVAHRVVDLDDAARETLLVDQLERHPDAIGLT